MVSELVALWIVRAAGAYAVVGVVFALLFVTRGVGRIDPDAARGSFGFRVLIFPGSVALWPILAAKWRRGAQVEEQSPHRDAARGGNA